MNNFLKKYPSIIVIGLIVLLCIAPTVQSKELIPPVHEFSTNYYDAYGEPDLYVSVIGDVELERGEEHLLKIVLSNRGVLHGVKYDTRIGTDEMDHEISLQELEYEKYRTTAIGIKAELRSTSDLIEIYPETSIQTLDELMPGVLPDEPFVFTLKISENAPAGEYTLLFPLEYQYQNEVEMSDGSTVRLGLPELDHTTYYKNTNQVLTIPIYIKPTVVFEIVDVDGELTAGSTSTVNVTYANIGELPANNAVARLVVMKPLSSSRSELSLGTIYPGDTKTISFEISADGNAIPKEYAISSEIKYIDDEDETSLSDALLVRMPLQKSEDTIPLGTFMIAGVFLILLYMFGKYARKR
ncbi:MAG: hypothetical protein K8R64_03785 [Methanosarcinaceae archaeon]|nr:hypothetical protein [Methanosarcinaceae archaeon]